LSSGDQGRWARGIPYLLRKRPGLPATWVRVLERHTEGVEALPGYVWLDLPGKVRHVQERELEFRWSAPRISDRWIWD
jgi:hypothetical protein